MSTLVIPQGYKAPLPNYELQRAIAFIKESFQTNLSNALNLRRVSAPLFVTSDSGLNDNLNGTEHNGRAFRTSGVSVVGPAEPTTTLFIYAVPNIILSRKLAREFHHNSLQRQPIAGIGSLSPLGNPLRGPIRLTSLCLILD